MRLVLVGPAPPLRGGIAQYTACLGQALRDRGHSVRIISFSRLYPRLLFPGQSQTDPGAQILPGGEARLDSLWPFSWKAVAESIVDANPEAVVFQWWHPFFGPCLAGVAARVMKLSPRVRRLALCHNLHSHEIDAAIGRRWLEDRLAARFLSCMQGFLVHSRELGQALNLRHPATPVWKIQHPVYDFYSEWEQETSKKPSGDGHPVLLFFGNVRRYKGLDILLEAAARLPADFDYRLVIAGDFYLPVRKFRELARTLGIADRIQWIDHYIPNQQVPALFRQADVVVLPYRSASQSGVVPLAYQFGVPVIASDVGAISEVVVEGRTGLLVPPERPDMLASAIHRFLSLEDREQFRREILAFRGHLSWGQVVDKILEILQGKQ